MLNPEVSFDANEGIDIDNDGPPKLDNFGEVSPRLFYKVGGRIWA